MDIKKIKIKNIISKKYYIIITNYNSRITYLYNPSTMLWMTDEECLNIHQFNEKLLEAIKKNFTIEIQDTCNNRYFRTSDKYLTFPIVSGSDRAYITVEEWHDIQSRITRRWHGNIWWNKINIAHNKQQETPPTRGFFLFKISLHRPPHCASVSYADHCN